MLCTGLKYKNNSEIYEMQDQKIKIEKVDENANISYSDKDGEEEEDLLLRNLPTSFDDFQTKEFHLKLERNFSSPRSSHRQSPVGGFVQESFVLPLTTVPTQLFQSKQLSQMSLASKDGSINSLIGSRTHSLSSNASHNNFDDLDDNDLEVIFFVTV